MPSSFTTAPEFVRSNSPPLSTAPLLVRSVSESLITGPTGPPLLRSNSLSLTAAPINACRKTSGPSDGLATRRPASRGLVLALMICVTLTGTANNFLGRIRAETLGKYNGVVVGVLDAVVYLLFNLVALAIQATNENSISAQIKAVLRCGDRWAKLGVWKYLVLAGVCDVADDITGLAAQPWLTTLMYALVNQTTVPFTVVCSIIMLKARYTLLESVSVIMVGVAAVVCVLHASDTAGDNSLFWMVFAASTTSFAALSFVCKELAFSQYEASYRECADDGGADSSYRKDDGHTIVEGSSATLNLFVLSTGVSITGVIVSVPVAFVNQALTSSDPVLPTMREGFRCLIECEDALYSYVAYAAVNLCFNLSMLFLTGVGSALLTFLSLKLAVPLVALLSPLPWPIIGAKEVGAGQWGLLITMLCGVAAFRYGNLQKEKLRGRHCCWPICS